VTTKTIIDGLGHVHGLIYADTASLPTPSLGALAVVDDGTGGVLYVALHDISGTLAWLAWTPLYNAILKNPPPGWNLIVNTNPGDVGLNVEGDTAIIALSSIRPALRAGQNGTTPEEAALSIERSNLTPGTPLAVTQDGDLEIATWLNGYGEITVRSYADLPAANSDHLGALARLVAGGSGTDTLWYCAEVGGVPTWVLFTPTVPTGFVFLNPASNVLNTIVGAASDLDPPLTVQNTEAAGDGFHAVANAIVLWLEQHDAPNDALIYINRDTADPTTPIATLRGGLASGSQWLINGDGMIIPTPVIGLPSPNLNDLYGLVTNVNPDSTVEGVYIGDQDSLGTPKFTRLGPASSTIYRISPIDSNVIQQSTDDGATWLDWYVPSPVNPGLPAPGGGSLDFWLDVLASGCYLPWMVPLGYTVEVLYTYGLWGSTQFGSPNFISNGAGINNVAYSPAPHDSRFATGRTVAQVFDYVGDLYNNDGTHPWIDALTAFQPTKDSFVALSTNISASGLAAMIQVRVRITPTPAAANCHFYNFRASEFGAVWYSATPVVNPQSAPIDSVYSDGIYGPGIYAVPNAVGGLVWFAVCLEQELTAPTKIIYCGGPGWPYMAMYWDTAVAWACAPCLRYYVTLLDSSRAVLFHQEIDAGFSANPQVAIFSALGGAGIADVKYVQFMFSCAQAPSDFASAPGTAMIFNLFVGDDGSPDGLVGGSPPP
jgi:hypothetical protein